jgi:hypothetical protein
MAHPIHPDRPLALLAFLGGFGQIAFWTLFFTGTLSVGEPGSPADWYEQAFPVADGFLAALLLIAGFFLWRGVHGGRFVMTAAAAMILYLGIVDLTFHFRQGLPSPLSADAIVLVALSLACVAGGAVALARCWRHRRLS